MTLSRSESQPIFLRIARWKRDIDTKALCDKLISKMITSELEE